MFGTKANGTDLFDSQNVLERMNEVPLKKQVDWSITQ